MRYRDGFRDRPAFFRSIRIDQDDPRSRDFHLTPTFLTVLQRVVAAFHETGSRALTVTGPYGTGKSATMLQIGHLVETGDPVLLEKVRDHGPLLADMVEETKGVSVLATTGSLRPLQDQLRETIERWARSHRQKALLARVRGAAGSGLNQLVDLVAEAASRSPAGLLLIWDELGKTLEFESQRGIPNDVFLLQLLAEAAARSPKEHPLVMIGILHQDFESYGRTLLSQRDDFAKVQGRFEDIAFSLPPGELVRLTSDAVSGIKRPTVRFHDVEDSVGQIADYLATNGLVPTGLDASTFHELCVSASPLHPVVTLVLGSLFKDFAQNERSLFGFLGSYEPFGVQAFLDLEGAPDENRLYSVADLYDYVISSMGVSVYHGWNGRRWSQIEGILGRAGDDPTATALVKTIGLLGLVASKHGLRITSEFLEVCVDRPVSHALTTLTSKSIIVYRQFAQSYRLWDGSDIDLEERIETARETIGTPSLAEVLSTVGTPRPIVARRHSIMTGSLRWFEVRYIDASSVGAVQTDPPPPAADGRVYLILDEADDLSDTPVRLPHWWQMGCTARVPVAVAEAARTLRYLEWVEKNTPELRGDETARHELAARRNEAEGVLETTVDRLLWHSSDALRVWQGEEDSVVHVPSDGLNGFLSDWCDRHYCHAPRISSEFVNRHELSSAGTAARNELLRRMIESPSASDLGIDGYPPHLQIYLAALKDPQIHREIGGQWGFVAPLADSTWHPAWAALEQAVREDYRTVAELWEELARPPLGMRRGLMPILTLAFILVYRDRISLVEDGSFVPEITMAHVERMIRTPERWRLRLTSLVGARAALVAALARRQLAPLDFEARDLLGMARPLVVFAQRLPTFTKATQQLAVSAQRVRHQLLTASDPADLLFRNLPEALGLPQVEDSTSTEVLDTYAEGLQQVIEELSQAYAGLLDRLEHVIFRAFGYPSGVEPAEVRHRLAQRAEYVQETASDLGVKAVALRLMHGTDREVWLESVSSAIIGRPPRTFTDRNEREFTVQAQRIARQFKHFETLHAVTAKKDSTLGVIRVGLTTADADIEAVVSPLPRALPRLADLVNWVESSLDGSSEEMLFVASELVRRATNASIQDVEEDARG
jgi:hypothetical protein